MSLGMMFPGQGSQSVGMLQSLASSEPIIEQTFAQASETLGYDLWKLCQRGPESRLNETEQTQPAMLCAGVAVWCVWCARGGALPAIASGHSLGEYSALVASGILEFTTAVKLVQQRARLMQQAVPVGEGAIAAVLGLEDETVISVCAAVSSRGKPQRVAAVNFNAPGQVVVAGHKTAVDDALIALREAGARRAVMLPMSVPVHCELMRPATMELSRYLQQANYAGGQFPVLHNADLDFHQGANEIAAALEAQLYTPVRWVDCVRKMMASPDRILIECGPGKVLAGLCRRIDRTIRCYSIFDSQSLEQALEASHGEHENES